MSHPVGTLLAATYRTPAGPLVVVVDPHAAGDLGPAEYGAVVASTFGGVYRFLLNKWYFDELYDAIFVRPTRALARVLWQTGDTTIIDGVPNGAAALAADVARGAVRLQTGRVASYAFTMIAGLAVFVTMLAFGAAR